jgi:hypothetical protein
MCGLLSHDHSRAEGHAGDAVEGPGRETEAPALVPPASTCHRKEGTNNRRGADTGPSSTQPQARPRMIKRVHPGPVITGASRCCRANAASLVH